VARGLGGERVALEMDKRGGPLGPLKRVKLELRYQRKKLDTSTGEGVEGGGRGGSGRKARNS